MSEISRSSLLIGATALSLTIPMTRIFADTGNLVKLYKSPSCGCCGAWADHMVENGFNVETINLEDMTPVKEHFGIPDQLQSCHTAIIGDYLIEGHVPAKDIKRLLLEKPKALGLTVPGMPMGSPGMDMGPDKEPYEVYLIGEKGLEVYSRYSA